MLPATVATRGRNLPRGAPTNSSAKKSIPHGQSRAARMQRRRPHHDNGRRFHQMKDPAKPANEIAQAGLKPDCAPQRRPLCRREIHPTANNHTANQPSGSTRGTHPLR
ncbi:hypothetical protein GCM10023170_096270 [Phytohabitans houttuyneae]|uniref:Uncharacterized protein n=1 Tax=Phytohabitans houttuyneae TaxID=1076126 RepID=A0A6V8KIX7_9ACTN|nr:hypothetical protein Phou_062690 [Phytohabitans houttuyneae]